MDSDQTERAHSEFHRDSETGTAGDLYVFGNYSYISCEGYWPKNPSNGATLSAAQEYYHWEYQ